MSKVRVLVQDGIDINDQFADVHVIKKTFNYDIDELSKCSIAVFTDETDDVLIGYALSTGIKIFILSQDYNDVQRAFPDIAIVQSYDQLLREVQAEIEIQYEYVVLN